MFMRVLRKMHHDTKSKYFERGWRIGVGIVLLNRSGNIFMGERIDNVGAWQMPQGGVNVSSNEELIAAAKRELYEETGIKSVKFLKKSKTWYYYHLPEHLSKKLWKGKFIGQKQKWFAFNFLGLDDEIDIHRFTKPEFRKWKWVPPQLVSKEIISFKKDIYCKVLDEFKDFIGN